MAKAGVWCQSIFKIVILHISDLERDPGGESEHLRDFEARAVPAAVCPACGLDQTFPRARTERY